MEMVIIGAVAAGMSAASKAKRAAPDTGVRVFGREDYISYAACGLPYYIGGQVGDQQHLIARSQEQFARQGIEVNTGCEASQILPQEQKIVIRKPGGVEEKVEYDKLIICTGARPNMPSIPGLTQANVFTVSTIPEAQGIREAIATGARKAVIIGAGYIGLEMADVLHQRGLTVTILQRSRQIASAIDYSLAEIVQRHLEDSGVRVLTETVIQEVYGDTTVRGVHTNHGDIPCDLLIVAAGALPNSELARDAGISLGAKGAILVNRRMETSQANIFAAGDCATAWHHLYGEDVYLPLGTTANKQGRVAGENAAGGSAQFSGIVGTAIMKVIDLGIGRTGLGSSEAEKLGLDLLSVKVDVNNRAGYYPQPGKGTVMLLFDRNGRVWGAQMVGPDNFAKRIDVFAAAVQMRCSLQELASWDLSYSPPYSPVWDPVLVAANVAMGRLRN